MYACMQACMYVYMCVCIYIYGEESHPFSICRCMINVCVCVLPSLQMYQLLPSLSVCKDRATSVMIRLHERMTGCSRITTVQWSEEFRLGKDFTSCLGA